MPKFPTFCEGHGSKPLRNGLLTRLNDEVILEFPARYVLVYPKPDISVGPEIAQ